MRRPIEHAIHDGISALVDGRWSRLGGARDDTPVDEQAYEAEMKAKGE